jgi:uncharacterized BrkB/YihY/UPF0761 family membrane protein
MELQLMEALVFTAAFAQVFLLGLNSKMLRDDRILAGAVTSFGITIAQYGMVWAVTNAGLSAESYILWAGMGGSAGITLSQYVYKWYEKRM